MADFFIHQLDYVFFLYGLAFLLLAAMAVPLAAAEESDFPWKYLGLFGLLHGLNEWLDMLALNLGDTPAFSLLRLGLMAASFVFLMEFGRAGMVSLGNITCGRWIYVPLSLLVALAGLAGLSGINAGVRYVFGLGGGLWAAAALYSYKRTRPIPNSSRSALDATAWLFAVYGLAAGLVVPTAGFFPASMLNHASFLKITGAPIQVIRCLLACGAFYFLLAFRKRSAAELPETIHEKSLQILWGLAGLLLCGWLLVNISERYAQERESRKNLARLDLARSTFERMFPLLEAIPEVMP